MFRRLATGLAVAALAAAGLLGLPAAAQAETHGPCAFHNANRQALYTNCTYNAVVFTVDVYASGDYDLCVPAKHVDRYLGRQYYGSPGEVQGVKNVHYLNGSYCSWTGG